MLQTECEMKWIEMLQSRVRWASELVLGPIEHSANYLASLMVVW